MNAIQEIFGLFIFSLLVVSIETCGGGSRKCSWTTCSTQYNDYTPSPSPGTCVFQKSVVRHIYSTHSRNGGCPGSTKCTAKDKSRYWCSCKEINHCWWASWGPWTGSIHHSKCGKQTRYRKGEKSYRYTGRSGSCNGVVTSCPRTSDSEERTWCNCRKADRCATGQWTGWTPVVENGKCEKQTRYHDKIPTYKYIEQKDNCYGINPNCPPRMHDNRVLCSCSYKECIEGSWTPWEIHSWTGNCPQEKRYKKYRSITKYKQSYTTCQGIGPQSCPHPVGDFREKVVTCPKLPIPVNGQHLSPACDGANSKCKAICQMKCKQTYKLVGSRYVTCQGDGRWSGKQGTCEDNEPPSIVCPVVDSFNNTENEDFGIVDLPDATATDNSGLEPKITMSHASPLKVMVGKQTAVTYTATDDAGNRKDCRITIEVKDVEPPKVVSCPDDKIFQTGKIPYQVFWGEPRFHDNVDKDNINVFPSHKNGNFFPRGKHTITYLARDNSFNFVKCIFTVQVELMQCPVYDPPKHGSATCNIRKDGIIETHLCTVACNKNAWFLKGPGLPVLYDFYVCGEHGQWRGQDTFDMTAPSTPFIPIPKGETPWPDCAVGNVPDGVAMDFQVFGGSCKDDQQIAKLKADFIDAIKKDIIISNLYCVTSTANCVVENFRVHCSSRKKRSTGANSNQIIVKFSIAVRDKKVSNSQKLEMAKLKSMSSSLNNQKGALLNKVKQKLPSIMKTSTATVNAQNAAISCGPGFEYKIVDGKQDAIERTKCLKCPRGTYYNDVKKTCLVCNRGYYQENEASLSCKKCPQKTSTIGKLAHDFHACKAICEPGTYSSTGLATCIACPASTYQPMRNSTSCISCPSGTVTSKVAATSLSDCSQAGVDILIHSEGCSDPNIPQGTCGISKILVDGIDHCPKKRGMNFVVLDAASGKFIEKNSFDWHNDRHSCDNTLNWIKTLKSNIIVLAAVQDEATSAVYSDNCYKALEMIGGKRPFQSEYRSSFAMIGYKGTRSIDWLKQTKSYYGRGPTELKGSIKLS